MKAILVDDELLALNYLEYQLLKTTDIEVIGKYSNPLTGKQMIHQHKPDLVFLDIQIPGMNGIELAERLLEDNPDLQVVFVTAFDQYAVKAFELNAIDYILKPVRADRLHKTLQRLNPVKSNPVKALTEGEQPKRLNLFGRGKLYSSHPAGQAKPIPLKWRTAKTQQLFFYLIQYHDQEVEKSVLADYLWPDIDMDKAYQQLYTAIYHMRKTLKDFQHNFLIRSVGDGYMLKMHDVHVDVEQFLTMTQSLADPNSGNMIGFEQALAIAGEDYLQGYDYVWAENRRLQLKHLWKGIAQKAVHWYRTTKELDKALALSLHICERFPFDEDAHFHLMLVYDDTGDLPAVYKEFHLLQEMLTNELQMKVRADIFEWYQKWLQKNAGNISTSQIGGGQGLQSYYNNS